MKHPQPRIFGTTRTGETVHAITLQTGQLSCEILTYGAVIRTLTVPDRHGNSTDIVLGYDSLKEYLDDEYYLGAAVGRVANRIALGRFTLNGIPYCLTTNSGKHHLHGGRIGFSHRIWSIRKISADSVTLSLNAYNNEEGYPGNLLVCITYTLKENSLLIRYTASSDKDTLCSLTNHSYFNLSGHKSGTAMNQRLQIFAQQYLPCDQEGIPIGKAESVSSSPMDFQVMLPIQEQLDHNDSQLNQVMGFDHNYIIDGTPGELRPAAIALSDSTGIVMQVDTTMPGMHFYTANFLPEGLPGKDRCKYGPRHAFCFETQFYPNAVNLPVFPTPILKAGAQYDHTTRFTFSAK